MKRILTITAVSLLALSPMYGQDSCRYPQDPTLEKSQAYAGYDCVKMCIRDRVPLDQLNARAKHALMGNLGIQYTYASEDRVEATMPVDERTRQPFGILHGGCLLYTSRCV